MNTKTKPFALVSLILLTAIPASHEGWAQQKLPRKQAFPSIRQRPWVGVVADPDGKNKGLRVSRTLLTSPAHKAGIQPGDLLVEAEGKPIKSIANLRVVLMNKFAGDTLTFKAIPKGKSSSKTYTLRLVPLPNQSQLIKSQWMARQIPDLPFQPLGASKAASLKQYRGKITVVEFWATWCGPCRKIASYLTSYQKSNPDTVNIIALSTESSATVAAYLKKQTTAPAYTIGLDSKQRIHKQLMVRAYPTVLILDDQHRLRKVLTGYNHPSDIGKAIDALKKLQKLK